MHYTYCTILYLFEWSIFSSQHQASNQFNFLINNKSLITTYWRCNSKKYNKKKRRKHGVIIHLTPRMRQYIIYESKQIVKSLFGPTLSWFSIHSMKSRWKANVTCVHPSPIIPSTHHNLLALSSSYNNNEKVKWPTFHRFATVLRVD